MKRYLLVPSAASSIPALVQRARELTAAASQVTTVLVTPRPRGVADRDVAAHIATANGVIAAAQLRQARVVVERTHSGDASPIFAIEDELRAHPHHYDAVVLASPPPTAGARLLGRDDHWRAEALPLPVFHVYERPPGRLPTPLPVLLARLFGMPGAALRFIARQLARPRLGIAIMLVPVLLYLTAGLGLALFVNRAFLFNELLAALLYSALIAGVVIIERTDPAKRPPVPDEETTERAA